MATSIIEKILGNNNLYTNNYITDVINLTKSIVIKNDNEALDYNQYVLNNYPTYPINTSDQSTWRYYRHLAGLYHPVDREIKLTSIDNGNIIPLTKTSMSLHQKTRDELLTFSLYYKELVDNYPEQELYIKSIICNNLYTSITDIINSSDFTIISYNKALLEDNELDLIYLLQETIEHYKHTKLIPYYRLSDNLFLSSQYFILYNFLLTKILSIRLQNAKTLKAHSYHIRNYLSSHHYLDAYYRYLTKKQALFLYRNLLYLDNHSGRNDIFKILIDKLFTERNISVVTYDYNQINELDTNKNIQYRFKQRLLNQASLVYSQSEYQLDTIKDKEFDMTLGNEKELTYHLSKIDSKFKNSLFNVLLSKDLETIIVDNTDTVKYKLIPMIIDYWAYLLHTNQINFLTTVVDPVNNIELKLSTKDLFKLYVIILYQSNNITLSTFPNYTIQRVFKDPVPETSTLIKLFYRYLYWYGDLIDDIKHFIPKYHYIATSSQSYEFIHSLYIYNIALWEFLTNTTDKDMNGQFELIIDRLHKTETYVYNDETVPEFLKRIGLESIQTYSNSILESLSFNILNSFYDNKLDFLTKNKYVQQYMIEIFKKFNSYTVQMISDYRNTSPILAGPKDVRYTISENAFNLEYFADDYRFNIDHKLSCRTNETLQLDLTSNHTTQHLHSVDMELPNSVIYESELNHSVQIVLSNSFLNDLDGFHETSDSSDQDQLRFLALNS